MIDHSYSDRVLGLTFARLGRPGSPLEFPPEESLSGQIVASLEDDGQWIPHIQISLFASASIEMWHRAVHSFLWSVALRDHSKIWSSVTGYYASHYVMRAFAHAFGFFKSFATKKIIQVLINHGTCVCSAIDAKDKGEHSFYWKVVKDYPDFKGNQLFRLNSERDKTSDCAHRNHANYSDHIGGFVKLGFPTTEQLSGSIEKISRIRRFAVTEVDRDGFPDLDNVQILAYQRLVTFRDFLDDRLSDNRFWRAHRDPNWCKGVITFHLEDAQLKVLKEGIR